MRITTLISSHLRIRLVRHVNWGVAAGDGAARSRSAPPAAAAALRCCCCRLRLMLLVLLLLLIPTWPTSDAEVSLCGRQTDDCLVAAAAVAAGGGVGTEAC